MTDRTLCHRALPDMRAGMPKPKPKRYPRRRRVVDVCPDLKATNERTMIAELARYTALCAGATRTLHGSVIR